MNVEKVRQDFPILQQKIHGRSPVYLDTACMSLKPVHVLNAIRSYYLNYTSCHGRVFHRFGRLVTERYDAARERFRRFLNAAKSKEIVFVRNTTEGINLVARGFPFSTGDVVLTSDIEHNSNLLPWQRLVKETGVELRIFKTNADTTFNLESFEAALAQGNVRMVAVTAQSNLSGVSFPVNEIVKKSHKTGAVVLIDAAQAVPSNSVDVRKLAVDFLVFSVHKMMGPTGIGVLYGKEESLNKLAPLVTGGETIKDTTYTGSVPAELPDRFEAGLQNYAGVIGAAAAVDYLTERCLADLKKHETQLNAIMTEEVLKIPGVRILGPVEPERRNGLLNFSIEDLEAHDLARLLDEIDFIMVRAGKQCVHSWFNATGAPDSLRASVYAYNTVDEAALFGRRVRELAKHLRKDTNR